jgi:RNA polymerase sigma-70 factor (ECF subfamily)
MMTSHASQSHDRFATTRWSMVMQLVDKDSPLARDALGDLAQRYWYPVYAFVRRCGQPPAMAEQVTRDLLRRLVNENDGTQQIASRHYRSYLLDRVQALLDGNWTAAASEPDVPDIEFPMPPDLERRFLRDHIAPSSPEQAFQRSFALVVLQRTLRRLRDEAAETGRADMCRALEPFLARDPEPGDYERVAAQLRTRKVTLILALKRLRQRLRELAALELSDTVSSADDLASEQAALLSILGEMTA